MSEGRQMLAELIAQLEKQLAAANARVEELEAQIRVADARLTRAESTIAACKAALKRVQAGFPSRSVDGGWGGSGDPAYADQVNKAIEAAEAAKGGREG